MTQGKVLFATDFSESSEMALAQVRAFAAAQNASILAVHVLSVPSSTTGEGMLHHGTAFDSQETAERKLRAVSDALGDIPHETRLLRGDPADEILKVATTEGVSMIAMGTVGRTGISRLLLGSVAEEVMRKAQCPVLTLRHVPKR
ncbi:MAG: universal stress protein [Phycisphaerae bacterium]